MQVQVVVDGAAGRQHTVADMPDNSASGDLWNPPDTESTMGISFDNCEAARRAPMALVQVCVCCVRLHAWSFATWCGEVDLLHCIIPIHSHRLLRSVAMPTGWKALHDRQVISRQTLMIPLCSVSDSHARGID